MYDCLHFKALYIANKTFKIIIYICKCLKLYLLHFKKSLQVESKRNTIRIILKLNYLSFTLTVYVLFIQTINIYLLIFFLQIY